MDSKILLHVGDIVAAHVSSNAITSQDVPHLIKTVYDSLAGLGRMVAVEDAPTPAMAVRASIKPHSIGCLECGKRLKSLRRHLATHGLTADKYRAKWSLPQSYPMVAADYSATRSSLAKTHGLGRSKDQN